MIIELPDVLIDEIAERVKKKLEDNIPGHLQQPDSEAIKTQHALACIHAKENISVQEVATLLNCSPGHVRNLVKKAKSKQAQHPIPFLDLDGVITFNREEVLAWSRQPKSTQKPKRGLHAVSG